ncbi:MAG: DUF3422 domain-containing protein [Hyphomicrobiaceae bacterium]|nr:DUF3422 domain-containing protein [Hyphomicrobiaceae bacterium]
MDETLPAPTRRFEAHPHRAAILGELHARPFLSTETPRVYLHYAFSNVAGAAVANEAITALCAAAGLSGPNPQARHHVLNFGGGRLKWERHSEFTTYAWDGPLDLDARPFGPLPTGHPFGTSFTPPGPLLVAARLDLLPAGEAYQTSLAGFDPSSLSVADAVDGRATVVTDFLANGDGRINILIIDRGLAPNQAGALAQRLLEVETYRSYALLALPEAQRVGPEVRRIEESLADITAAIRESDGLDSNRDLLGQLSQLTADLEAGAAASSYRFGASRAYWRIVLDRLGAIGESPVPGFPTWSSFLTRRMGPAIRTVEVTEERQANLSRKLSRAAQLLRTRVDIDLEQQNRDLLEKMNTRAQLQLRLQQTVEGLSVAAISYYVIGLLGYLFKAGKEAHLLPVDPSIATGISVPFVVAFMYWLVGAIRRKHMEHGEH